MQAEKIRQLAGMFDKETIGYQRFFDLRIKDLLVGNIHRLTSRKYTLNDSTEETADRREAGSEEWPMGNW